MADDQHHEPYRFTQAEIDHALAGFDIEEARTRLAALLEYLPTVHIDTAKLRYPRIRTEDDGAR